MQTRPGFAREWPLAVLLVLGIAAVGSAQDTKEDRALTQGSRKVESSKDGGQDDPSAKGLVLTFKGGTLTVKRGEEIKTGTYKLDPSKTPKWIDATIDNGSFLAIYELNGDTLRICHAKAGGNRPTEFISDADSHQVMTVLKRE